MDFKEKILNHIKNISKQGYLSNKEHNNYFLLKNIIEVIDKDLFNESIKFNFYNDVNDKIFEECFIRYHKYLRQLDLFNNNNHEMLLYHYIYLSNNFYYIIEGILKSDYNSIFYDEQYDDF